MVIKGKTKSGFKYEVESKAFSSWRFTRALKAAQDKKASETEKLFAMMDAFEASLGDEMIEQMEAHLAATLDPEQLEGGIPARNMLAEMSEIINKVGEAEKNSLPSPQ